MAIFFGYKTAEHMLNSAMAHGFRPSDETPSSCGYIDHEVLGSIDLSCFELPETEPLDLVVASPERRRNGKRIHCHVSSGSLPHGAYLEASPDVYVSSPALCLLQRSPSLSFVDRIQLCAQYCGTYAPSKKDPRGFITRDPLATLEEIENFAMLCNGVNGRQPALNAIPWTLPNAASPMETKMVMPFYLPGKTGGFGLPLPTMNYELTLSPRASAMTGKEKAVVDAYWPDADFGLEYQSEMFHHDDDRYGQDIGRQLALETMGKIIRMVTFEQLRNPVQLERLAEIIAFHVGVELHPEVGKKLREGLVQDILSE